MAIFHNIDRIDAELNTKHPFRWTCPLSIGGGEFPVRELISIRLHTFENTAPPFRISRFEINDTNMHWSIQDSKGRDHLTIDLPDSATDTLLYPVRDTYGCMSGHMVCTPVLLRSVYTIIRNAGGSIDTAGGDFVFDNSCYVPMLSGVFKVISVNGTNCCSDITLRAGDNVKLEFLTQSTTKENVRFIDGSIIRVGDNEVLDSANFQSGGVIRASAVSDYKELDNKTVFTTVMMNSSRTVLDNPDTSWHLLLRSTLASNLRVVTKSGEIHLTGVQDV